jgi:hypothetical protein
MVRVRGSGSSKPARELALRALAAVCFWTRLELCRPLAERDRVLVKG